VSPLAASFGGAAAPQKEPSEGRRRRAVIQSENWPNFKAQKPTGIFPGDVRLISVAP
jgi:hypothetical protein